MKRFAILGLLTALIIAVPALAEQPETDQQAAMDAWAKASTPGEFQAFFASRVGTWNIASRMWMGPDTDPVLSESVATSEMILGGRYLQEEAKGTSMGLPFEGLGITGYDNTTGVVTYVWYDNMGTTTTILTGKYDEPGKPLKLSGTMVDPYSGDEMPVRSVMTFVSANEGKFEYFGSMMAGAPEMKLMELTYTRVE